MEPIQSHVNLGDAEHRANRAAMDQELADYPKRLAGDPEVRFHPHRPA
jgi:hypothetical protein